MKQKVVWIVLTLLAFNSLSSSSYALPSQTLPANTPLIIALAGDYFTWDGVDQPLKQRTNWHYNGTPILSSDGRWIAYNSVATIGVPPYRAQPGREPSNIWVLEVATNEAKRIADQPRDVVVEKIYDFAGRADGLIASHFILRSDPCWLPNEHKLVWAEMRDYEQNSSQLVIYDLDDKKQSLVAKDLPLRRLVAGNIYLPGLACGPGMIAVESRTAADKLTSMITVYDLSGHIIAKSETINAVSEFFWVQTEHAAALAVAMIVFMDKQDKQITTQWMLMDPITGMTSDLSGVPELYSLQAPHGASIYMADPSADFPSWMLALPNQSPITLGNSISLAIAPDGESIAYEPLDVTQPTKGPDGIYIIGKAGTPHLISGTAKATKMVWGSLGWRLRKP